MAAGVYRAHTSGRHLLAQAPTGIGKTMASLFGTLRAAPAQGTDKVFYLTAKTTGRQLALDALQRLGAPAALPLRGLDRPGGAARHRSGARHLPLLPRPGDAALVRRDGGRLQPLLRHRRALAR